LDTPNLEDAMPAPATASGNGNAPRNSKDVPHGMKTKTQNDFWPGSNPYPQKLYFDIVFLAI